MSILRKNNQNDPYYFLPDNKTIGTFQYYKRRYGESFLDWQYEIWEAETLLEGEEQTNKINIVNQQINDYNKRLLLEIETRNNEHTDKDSNEQIEKSYEDYKNNIKKNNRL